MNHHLAACAIALCGLLPALPALAGHGATVLPVPATHIAPAAAVAKHKLLTTILDVTDVNGTTGAAGFTTVDTTTYNCLAANGCTVEFQLVGQEGNNTTASNRWAVCGQIDGSFVDGCAVQGNLPTDGSYPSGSNTESATLTKGKHTLTTVWYSDDGASLGNGHSTYRIYTP